MLVVWFVGALLDLPIGEALAGIRRKAGLTQVEVARRLRKPQSFVSSYEAGQRRIDVLELGLIASTLSITPHQAFAAILTRHVPRKRRPAR